MDIEFIIFPRAIHSSDVTVVLDEIKARQVWCLTRYSHIISASSALTFIRDSTWGERHVQFKCFYGFMIKVHALTFAQQEKAFRCCVAAKSWVRVMSARIKSMLDARKLIKCWFQMINIKWMLREHVKIINRCTPTSSCPNLGYKISSWLFPFPHFATLTWTYTQHNGFILRLSFSGMVRIIELELRCHSAAEFVNTRRYCFDNSIWIGDGNVGDVLVDDKKPVRCRSKIVIEKNVN